MANNLNLYDPLWYANEALIELNKALGMSGRVHRGFDRTPQGRGSTIMISKPSTFTAQDAPSTVQDLNPDDVAVVLNQWKEVKFKLTDKELTFSGEKIITDHIRPAAIALANNVDIALNNLYKDIPWVASWSNPAAVSDITNARKVLFNNGVPMEDLHMEVDGTIEAELLNLSAFSQQQGAGADGVETQRRGYLGQKFGFEVFANQNVATHTAGVAADSTGTLNGAHAAGAESVSIAGLTAAGTVKAGDTFVIAGNAQRYVFRADATADGAGAIANALISPPLAQAYGNGAVVTIQLTSGAQSIAFHRNAFALAMAPLTTMGNQLGAKIESVVDPLTGLALRSRLFYVGDTSSVYVALDMLYGVKTLDPNLAVRIID
jgi:hypothetical protein